MKKETNQISPQRALVRLSGLTKFVPENKRDYYDEAIEALSNHFFPSIEEADDTLCPECKELLESVVDQQLGGYDEVQLICGKCGFHAISR